MSPTWKIDDDNRFLSLKISFNDIRASWRLVLMNGFEGQVLGAGRSDKSILNEVTFDSEIIPRDCNSRLHLSLGFFGPDVQKNYKTTVRFFANGKLAMDPIKIAGILEPNQFVSTSIHAKLLRDGKGND